MKDDYTTNSHYLTSHISSVSKVGRMYIFELGSEGPKPIVSLLQGMRGAPGPQGEAGEEVNRRVKRNEREERREAHETHEYICRAASETAAHIS